MEEEKEGKTFGDIVRTIFTFKWLVIGLALFITVAGTLVIYFGLNSMNASYVRSFSVVMPGNGTTYPDNTPFSYRNILSLENMERVKNENEELEYLDLNELVDGAMSIEREENENAGAERDDIVYVVKVKTTFFHSIKDAQTFIDGLSQMPVNYVMELAANKDVYLRNYDNVKLLEDKVDILVNQHKYLIDEIAKIDSTSGNSPSRTNLITKLDTFGKELTALQEKMRREHYVLDSDYTKSVYDNMITNLTNEKKQLEEALKLAYGRFEDADNPSANIQPTESMVQLSKDIAELSAEIEVYNSYYSDIGSRVSIMKEADENFKADLSELHDNLSAIVAECQKTIADYYNLTTFVNYTGKIDYDGRINFLLSVLISLVIGLVVAAIVGYIVGAVSNGKKAAAQTSAPDESSAEEPVNEHLEESENK